MQEMQLRFLGQEDPLEKEMATRLVFLPEKCHGQRSLTGYSPWGRKRVEHDLGTKQQNLSDTLCWQPMNNFEKELLPTFSNLISIHAANYSFENFHSYIFSVLSHSSSCINRVSV